MIVIVPLFFVYLAMFAVVGLKAKRMGRSALWWLFLSLVLTPIITFIMLRGNELKARRIQEKADALKD
ncbi:hypothetical protein [Achromobacter aegrifaciens]